MNKIIAYKDHNNEYFDHEIENGIPIKSKSEDALSGENPINIENNFTNTTPTMQPVWARIVNIDITEFTCLGYAKVGELYVEPKPIANPVTIEKQCDGDSPLDLDSQDGIYPFDVSLIEEQVINGQLLIGRCRCDIVDHVQQIGTGNASTNIC